MDAHRAEIEAFAAKCGLEVFACIVNERDAGRTWQAVADALQADGIATGRARRLGGRRRRGPRG